MNAVMFVALIILAWTLLSVVICTTLCMMSARFGEKLERRDFERASLSGAGTDAFQGATEHCAGLTRARIRSSAKGQGGQAKPPFTGNTGNEGMSTHARF